MNCTVAVIYLFCTGIDRSLSNDWRDVESLAQIRCDGGQWTCEGNGEERWVCCTLSEDGGAALFM